MINDHNIAGAMGVGMTVLTTLRHDKFLTDPHFAAKDIWEKTGCVK